VAPAVERTHAPVGDRHLDQFSRQSSEAKARRVPSGETLGMIRIAGLVKMVREACVSVSTYCGRRESSSTDHRGC
jgi:hypothetical protein